MNKITVVGLGYVGISNAILLAQNNEVVALDVDLNKINLVNKGISPIIDFEVSEYLKYKQLNLTATENKYMAYKDSKFIVIATPTNFDTEKNFFDTKTIENVLEDIEKINPLSIVVIKSTVPVGYTKKLQERYKNIKIIFSPEFLREGKALYDNLYPSRIIMGDKSVEAQEFAALLKNGAKKKEIPILFMDSTEAEAVKLFSNTYLAMRVAYFNELDTYSELKNLNTKNIIDGVCLDPRIGNYYNNPSFGYGGYCLPKDTKQLMNNYKGIPNKIITAIVEANDIRKHHISEMILSKHPTIVGVYRLVMKSDSDNFRESAIKSILKILKDRGITIIIYEPSLKTKFLDGIKIEDNLSLFKQKSDIILANRLTKELEDVKEKIYTRDLYNRD